MLSQRVLMIGGLVVLVAAGRAEEPRGASPQTSDRGYISEAQKSFQELRDAKIAPREQTSTGFPSLSTPELTLNRSESKPARGSKNLAPKKSPNWLIEGVLGNDPRRTENLTSNRADSFARGAGIVDPNNPASESVDLDPAMGLSSLVQEPSPLNSGSEAERRNSEPHTKAQAPNPLSEFMNSWISAQDRQLLLPNETRTASLSGVSETRNSSPPRALGRPELSMDAHRSLDVKDPVRDNPYIVVQPTGLSPRLEPSRDSTTLAASEYAMRSSTIQAPPVIEAPRPTSNKPAAREFGTQDENGKYFRQLNRF